MKRITFSLLLASSALLAGSAHSQALLADYFDSPTLDPTRWTTINGAQFSEPVDLGGGDYAMRLQAGNGQYNVGVVANDSFNRGDNLRVTFMFWHADDDTGQYGSLGGPWVKTNNTTTLLGLQYPNISWIAAGFGSQENWTDGQTDLRWAEGGNTPDGNNPSFMTNLWTWADIDSGLRTAFQNAISKQTAVTIRITIGDNFGARCEYSTAPWPSDDADFQVATMNGGTEIDTTEAPYTAGANYWGNQTVLDQDPLYIGFGVPMSTAYFVDNLVVEDDNNEVPVEISTFLVD